MKLKLHEMKDFLQRNETDPIVYIYSFHYIGATVFGRLLSPTPVIPSYEKGFLTFFKIGLKGQKLKSSIPFKNQQLYSFEIFDNEQECILEFRQKYLSKQQLITKDYKDFCSLFESKIKYIEAI